MVRIFQWLVRLITAVGLLVLLALFVVYYLGSRSLPDYDVTREVRGLSGPVEIVRNNANVPHVFGKSEPDVFFGLGYAHAQDRLWQMTMLRRTAQGRLSEMFGPRTLRSDELMRRLDIYRLAQEALEVQDAPARAALSAYAAGVNAWLARVNDEALGRGAPEFFFFDNDIAPWQPADSLAVLKLIGVRQAGHLQDEVLRARATLALTPKQVTDVLPDMPGTGTAALPDYAALFEGIDPAIDFAALDAPPAPDPFSPVPARGFAGASNAWAAAPSRAAAGGTLLANDPHMSFSAPTIWYLARIELASGGVIGATIPGMPLVLAGRSDAFGWGITASWLDDQDLFIEQLNPDNPAEVLTPEGYKPMTSRSSIIQVMDGAPVTLTLQWSENGAILPGHLFNLSTVTPRGHVAALSWSLLRPDDRSMSAMLKLMRAGSIAQGLTAGLHYVAPSFNVTMVDRDTIALKMFGAMPRRAGAHETQGRIPSPGWRSENRWLGYANYAANPEFVAPAGGIVGNTNNKILERPFPLHVSYAWGDSQRIRRWERLMQAREVHTRESFIEAQLDTVSPTARALLPLVGADLWFTGEAAPEGSQERLRQRALALLANWNGDMNEHMPEPLLYAAWMRALQARLIRDELGPLALEFTHIEPVFIDRVYRNVDGAAAWCDVIQSASVESCTDIARAALDDALLWIGETYGGETEALRWGDAHQAAHDHTVLGQMPFIGWFANLRHSTSGGDNTLMRGLGAGVGAEPFLSVQGAGYRGVYDFADPGSSLFITATGQSGHLLSRHYDDLGELWRQGEYIPMSLDPNLARAASVGITHLVPATP